MNLTFAYYYHGKGVQVQNVSDSNGLWCIKSNRKSYRVFFFVFFFYKGFEKFNNCLQRNPLRKEEMFSTIINNHAFDPPFCLLKSFFLNLK